MPALGQVEMLEAGRQGCRREASFRVTVLEQLSIHWGGVMLLSGGFMWTIIEGCSKLS